MIPDDELGAAFRRNYGREPAVLVRAPGRINLMGDHIDYLGLPVLPMALQQSVRIALAPREDALVRVRNTDGRFGDVEFPTSPALQPVTAGHWENYLRAGVRTALAGHAGSRRGCDALVASDLPVAAGLSSSSALVVAAALMILAANDLAWEPLALAEALARGERFVGTEGGGMDQAVSLCARAGHALRIRFAPLQALSIRVPRGWQFLVAPSLRESRKSAEMRAAYNERSRSARAALAQLDIESGEELLAEEDGGRQAQLRRVAAENPRLRHVLSEAQRVHSCSSALLKNDAATFGRELSASHRSLRDDYQVSTPELDRIVELSLDAGALGARLTGAGFGGCAIALCTADSLPQVRAALQQGFYTPQDQPGDEHMFVARPAAGAAITRL